MNKTSQKPLKILYVVEATGGGVAKHVIELSKKMLEKGHNIHIIYSPFRMDDIFKNGMNLLQNTYSNNITFHKLDIRKNPNPRDLSISYKIRKYVKKNGDFDIIHAHSSKAGIVTRLATLGIKTPIFYTPHSIVTNNPSIKRLKKLFYKTAEILLHKITRNGQIIAVSNDERQHIINLGIKANQVYAVNNGIELLSEIEKLRLRKKIREKINVNDKTFLVGIIGRFSYQKAIDIFLKTVHEFIVDNPNISNKNNVKFAILGYGELEQNLHKLAKELDIDNHIIWLKNEEIQGNELFHALDTYILSSHYEGMPYVLIEALGAGLPIISTRVNSVNDIVDEGKNGYIVELNDYKTIAKQLQKIFLDKDLHRKMSRYSLEKSKLFTLDKMTKETENLYYSKLQPDKFMKNKNNEDNKNKLKKIIFIHEGRAIYPDIQAYKKYFESRYETEEILYDELDKKADYSDSILWYMMGFYPKKIKAGFVIHDYRSVSIGRFLWLKNTIKKYLNHKPDLRIFLNDFVKKTVGLKDSIDSLMLDMGVPEDILKYRDDDKQKYKYDFCYIGSISQGRDMHTILQEFVKTYKDSKTFILAGRVEDSDFFEEFKNNKNIIYAGLIPQNEAFELVQDSEFAVCYLPKIKPFCYQTPTKLLEYIALNKKIIINDCPSNIETIKKFNTSYFLMKNNKFPNSNDLNSLKDNNNKNFDYTKIIWNNVIKNSGINKYI